MSASDQRPIDAEALNWAIRMSDADADWDMFLAWLEAAPGNSERYDRAVAQLQDVDVLVASVPVAAEVQPANDVAGRGWRLGKFVPWAGVAAAAAVVGVVGLRPADQGPQSYVVASLPGQPRTINLGDGSSVQLAGGSRVRLDRADQRAATVEQGQMLFHVRHDAAQPFRVRVGDLRLIDLGTVFDVKATPTGAQVAVAEGAVMVDPSGAALRLGPGQMVVANGTTLQRRDIAPANVGEWRQGRLVFEQASLEEVAADLSGQLGQPVRAASSVAGRAYSGALDLRAIKNRPELLARLLGVTVRQDRGGWILDASG